MHEDHLIPNTTQVPNVILDLLIPFLNDGEARVLMYLCRRTYGFNRETDSVSRDQFVNGICSGDRQLDFGAGVSRQGAMNALEVLKSIGIVEQLSGGRGRGNIPVFKLNLKCEIVKWLDLIRQEPENAREKIVQRLDLIREKSLPYGPFNRKPANEAEPEKKVEDLDLSEKVKTAPVKGQNDFLKNRAHGGSQGGTKPSNTKPRKDTLPTLSPQPDDSPPRQKSRRQRATPIVDDYQPRPQDITDIEQQFPTIDWQTETKKFLDYDKAYGPRWKDHDAAWRNWMRNANTRRDACRKPANPQAQKDQERYSDGSLKGKII